MAVNVTSKELSARRRFALDKMAKEAGFASWGRLSTHLKKCWENGKPIIITVGAGKKKEVYPISGVTGSQTA